MNKTVVIAGSLVGLLLVGGIAYVMLRPDEQSEDSYSGFRFTNDATERPADASGEFVYGEEGFSEYGGGDISAVSENEGDGYGSGNSSYESGVSDRFPAIEPAKTVFETDAAPSAKGYGTQSTRTGTAAVSPRTTPLQQSPGAETRVRSVPSVLSVLSPSTGDTISNDDGCPDNDNEDGASSCIPRSIARIFWEYGDPTARITLELRNKAGNRVRTFQTKGTNSGRYTWEYSPTIPDGEYKVVATAYAPDGDQLASAEGGFFTVKKNASPIVSITPPAGNPSCPPVSTKVRTYTPSSPSAEFFCSNPANGGCLSSVQLRHYRYPETVQIGNFMSFLERCALRATPGSRTCPYTYNIYANSTDIGRYSVMTRDPDSTNDPNEVGDRQFTAYLKPVVGPTAANRAFDMSIPISFSPSEAGETYDFHWYHQNQNLYFSGQWAISECEGDFSERAVFVSAPGDIWDIRPQILATDGLEGAQAWKNILALKTGKTYYFNLRWVYSTVAPGQPAGGGLRCLNDGSGGCLSPFVSSDAIPDNAMHAHALWRQITVTPGVTDALDFYRWKIYQYPFQNFPTEAQLETDPFFRRPGEAFIDYRLYNPACNAAPNSVTNASFGVPGISLTNALLDSQCNVRCGTGYVGSGNRCVVAP